MWIFVLIVGVILWLALSRGETSDAKHITCDPIEEKPMRGSIILDEYSLTFRDGVVYFQGSAKYNSSMNFVYGYYEKSGEGNTWIVYDQDHRLKIGTIEEKNDTQGDICLYRYEYAQVMIQLENESLRKVCEEHGGKMMKRQGLILDREWNCAWYNRAGLFDAKTDELIARFEGNMVGAAAAFVCRAYDELGSHPYGKWYKLRPEEEKIVEV